MRDEGEFEPRLGRMRAKGGKRGRSYVSRVLAATNLARGGGAFPAGKKGSFSGNRIGRGAGVGNLLAARGGYSALRRRRVIIKASIVKLAGKGAAGAAAHLRYLQRDGTTREGESGALYGRDEDMIDGKEFRARGAGDRHQFRFIVSPEDGTDYDDLKPLTRRLMARVEEDLGTRLDWVAVDHFNTGHPHTHIVVRGKDHLGADLVIARDYLTVGMRERAAELIDLDLGPRSAREIESGLRAEVEQERLTSLDRAMLRDRDGQGVVGPARGSAFDQTLRAGRLAKLAKLGLAEPLRGMRWQLAAGYDETLKRMGERGDIIRTMQRAFATRGIERARADQLIYDPAAADARPLVGRLVGRGLADEHADRHYLIVDGVDGRGHFVGVGKGSDLDLVAEGSIVRIDPRQGQIREADRTVAAVAAANAGRYDVDAHLRHDPSATEAFAETHVRRLDAMRRLTGLVDREPSGVWVIAEDHLERAAKYEARLLADRPATVAILSPLPLAKLVDADAATWLDRDLVSADRLAVRNSGFGADVRDAQERRRQWLVAHGFAEEAGGATTYPAGLIATLQRRELLRIAGQLSDELGLPFVEASPPGARIDGVLKRPVDLISGRFALIEKSREFTLVPWRPVLDRQLGKPVSGIVRGDGVNWSVGRGRGGPTIS
ncbi:relaxase/mobilization nuclease RlxS [Sphingomonas sp.]|uniref:relaxase/mobilization nuclease RlxS n=1 Tax=Sphingomonas sp. TaxID=28214 RepID=UPI002E345FA8|nr:relaxase/mobilization nuclease RlxS [Sphingomonas sp.]HEX4693614.1 relaxase/mobilization nuclease RlxS [Sphingomonas sp.]